MFTSLRKLICWLNEPVDRPLFQETHEDWQGLLEQHGANRMALLPIQEFLGQRPLTIILSYTRWAIRKKLNDPAAIQALAMGGVFKKEDRDLYRKITHAVERLENLRTIDALNRECLDLLDKLET